MPEIDRYRQILRFSLTVEDLVQYLQREQPEEPIPLDKVREIADFMESLEKEEQIEDIIEQVLKTCITKYQNKKQKNLSMMTHES